MPFDGRNFPEVATVLLEGRRRVETSWFQPLGKIMDIDHHCAMLAISRQNVGQELTQTAMRALAYAIYGSDDCNGIVPWNDAPGRTQDEVLSAYDRAIASVL